MKYDVVIPSGRRDVHRVPLCVESLKYLDPQPENIYVITPDPSMVATGLPIQVLSDDDVFKFDRKGKNPNWLFQQFIKLFQNITKNDCYMAVDSDTVFLRKFPVLSPNNKPMFWRLDYATNTEEAYRFINESIGVERILPYSMMAHSMMFDKGICNHLLAEFIKLHPNTEKQPVVHFYDWTVENMDTGRVALSEWELYANFVANRYPILYDDRIITGIDGPVNSFVPEDIVRGMVEVNKNKFWDILAIHSRTHGDSY